MLVDEVEVPEAVDISQRGVIADGMAMVGVGQSGQNVPRRRNRQEEQGAGYRLQLAPASPQSAHHEKWNRGRDEEDRGHQSLGQSGQAAQPLAAHLTPHSGLTLTRHALLSPRSLAAHLALK